MNNLLFIGLNGYAGSGKDTVAKMFKTILSKNWESLEECKKYYFNRYTNPTISATYHAEKFEEDDSKVLCIAYADQLKEICAKMFGIPRQRFYQNKSTAWICINDKFQYTEIKPDDDHIVTADEYYYSTSSIGGNQSKMWMSLREILVYIGTYVLQSINKKIFVNIVRNTVKEEQQRNPNLKYVIVTDNRFNHELEYIYENNGITISITRNSIEQLDNVAEHDLDDMEDYNYIIDNSGTYDELIEKIWNIVHNNIEFENITEVLYNRDNINNYLRLIKIKEDKIELYKLCSPMKIQQLYKSDNDISVINPTGGPMICVNEVIDGTENMIPIKIVMDEQSNQFLIYIKREDN